jgi:hypothetical protein
MQEREAEKSAALADITVVLNQLEAERRNPDHWERVHLVSAFAAVFSGCYGLAAVEAHLALTAPDERSPMALLPNDDIYHQCDLPLFTRILQAAHTEPAAQFPHFGPVVLQGAAKREGKAWL